MFLGAGGAGGSGRNRVLGTVSFAGNGILTGRQNGVCDQTFICWSAAWNGRHRRLSLDRSASLETDVAAYW